MRMVGGLVQVGQQTLCIHSSHVGVRGLYEFTLN